MSFTESSYKIMFLESEGLYKYEVEVLENWAKIILTRGKTILKLMFMSRCSSSNKKYSS